jgi:hypothetical protein
MSRSIIANVNSLSNRMSYRQMFTLLVCISRDMLCFFIIKTFNKKCSFLGLNLDLFNENLLMKDCNLSLSCRTKVQTFLHKTYGWINWYFFTRVRKSLWAYWSALKSMHWSPVAAKLFEISKPYEICDNRNSHENRVS